ncbi:MAG TPA: flagellar biosynthesis anti-sigma factor FlgM [Steroidobacteraceae bacterium]
MTTIHHGLPPTLSGVGSGSADKTQATQGQSAQAQTPELQGSDSPSSAVQITPAAQLMANLEQQIASTPEVDQSQVDSIRQALSNGSYQIIPARIADGLLAAQNFASQAGAARLTTD